MSIPVIVGIIAIVLVSITSHEAAHGFAADRLGDSTAREHGRLTLNPIPHIDPFFTILLPLLLILIGSSFIFGGAKPVPVNVARLRHPRRDWALVGAAGPLTNIAIAFALAAVFSLVGESGLATDGLRTVLAIGIFFNALLAVINLIPIPPLDGSRVVQYFLSHRALAAYRRLEQFGILLLVALLIFVPGVWRPLMQAILGLVHLVAAPFGTWPEMARALQGAL